MSQRLTLEEMAAIIAAETARDRLRQAIDAYARAGFGSLVTSPLREALALAERSLSEVST